MKKRVLVLVGTRKGAFILEGDARRKSWELRGPFCEHWPMNHVVGDAETGAIYGGGGNEWFGPAVWKSTDLGKSWTHSSAGLAYETGEEPIKSVWSVAPRNGSLYAGVQPAGLFRSDDGGQTLAACRGTAEASVAAAMEPRRRRPHPAFAGAASRGQGPDLGRHLGGRRLPHRRRRRDLGAAQPRHARRLPARGPELSGVRPVRAQSGDGARNARPALPAEPLRHVPQRRRRQELAEHRKRPALELRLPDGGASARSRHRLPDPAQRRLRRPLRARRQGRGLAHARRRQELAGSARRAAAGERLSSACCRQAMATDRLEPAGVYFGTGTGTLFASADEGDSWTPIAEHLPSISSVETLVVES